MMLKRMIRHSVRHIVAAALVLMPALPSDAAPNQSQATMTATSAVAAQQAQNARSADEPMTIYEKEGFGCLATGGVATALTALAGSHELLLVFGGTITPPTPVGLVVAASGTIFASFCFVGALATPAVLRIVRYYSEPAPTQ